MLRIGLDIGSTTIKCIVLDEQDKVLHSSYDRHHSQIIAKSKEVIESLSKMYSDPLYISVSGSAGMGLAQKLDLDFSQEIYATRKAIQHLLPESDVVIELGGEDAKILFFNGGMDFCMNGSCAGGTGSFIDQMASLLQVSSKQLNELAKKAQRLYPIASRCGVFAKSDIQPLLNQGARKEDIAASIFRSVVSQTIAGLAHGRSVEGNVVYLGGPLTFFSELRKSFDEALNVRGINPDLSLYYVAFGAAALAKGKSVVLKDLLAKMDAVEQIFDFESLPPLFKNEPEKKEFHLRHSIELPKFSDLLDERPKNLYVGIDAGSTTTKCAAIDEMGRLCFSSYDFSGGTPIEHVRKFLLDVQEQFPDASIAASAATGYGEELIQAAFRVDFGVVETIAHYLGAQTYDPEVDFIIDIGGQDIKCFHIHEQTVDQIYLNEACSSGCGSFLSAFAQTLGYDMETFSKKALESRHPVDLGSRCTVFMNSRVKQAQKDGASLEDIAAGLAISVVKNALYKVIRIPKGQKPGEHILVQGGTFLNDAVLRAFELETNATVIRPAMASLMGAYGAALYARSQQETLSAGSTILKKEQLRNFQHQTRTFRCKGCTNSCLLTMNSFGHLKTHISGNRCDKPLVKRKSQNANNIYEYKRIKLAAFDSFETEKKTIGIPLVLNMYELLPFWHTLFSRLGFGVTVSGFSDAKLYHSGQSKIPSDTVCYPAKLSHGHIERLKKMKCDHIFWPCLSYNLDEGKSVNHYNCPIVAYYAESAQSTNSGPEILRPYFGIHRPKDFKKRFTKWIRDEIDPTLSAIQIHRTIDYAYQAYYDYMDDVARMADSWLEEARKKKQKIIILCGRPYHIDPEVIHGIDQYLTSLGCLVLSEDSIAHHTKKADTDVLNQWTYHARLYAAAEYVAKINSPDLLLVQLVSFGCGVDAITADEVRAILEDSSQLYTQIKIDETSNLGAIRIRLRSMLAAADSQWNPKGSSSLQNLKREQKPDHETEEKYDQSSKPTGIHQRNETNPYHPFSKHARHSFPLS
ncbi:acyl-CoA dehydratase activase [Ileibacterium valens]|uniref:acyl-CoA dehydratase activase n=2 Tax=Ileibacterium valens TaxID=1862668 RepID=UPI0024B979DC|nr:acyl-CoA dehydratase activase [Ileibacterium valens]